MADRKLETFKLKKREGDLLPSRAEIRQGAMTSRRANNPVRVKNG